jgi:hypothetical protein
VIWNPLSVLFGTASGPEHASHMAARWQRARRDDTRLVEDVIVLGRIMESLPVEIRDGAPMRAPVDPNQLLVDQGRRELALELLALMEVDRAILAQMIRDKE